MDKYQQIAAQFGADFVDLRQVRFTPEILPCLPADLARIHRAMPISFSGNRLVIAMSDPSDLKALDCLHSALGKELEIRVADQSQLDTFIRQFYGDDNSFSSPP